ncbi:MAG TPA: zf-HC2 domain-containing protein, partial [Acidimicrobiia bacterium]|nr:zf-HC2 domain-containing protein [Acidimicrobiia bacterium]
MTTSGRDPGLPEDLISAYLDGELAPAERAAVEERVAASSSWATILREVRETRAAVRGLPAPEPPAG